MSSPNLEWLLSDEIQKELKRLKTYSSKQLAFQLSDYSIEERYLLFGQVEGPRRVSKKIPSWVMNPKIIYPFILNLEQSSSEEAAKLKIPILSGSKILDLTGGFGVDSIEFAKAGFEVIHNEKDTLLSSIVSHNAKAFGLYSNFNVENQLAEDLLKNFIETDKQVHTIFIDPSRRDKDQNRVILLQDYRPNIIEILDDMKKISDRIIIKISPLFDLTELQKQLPSLSEIHIHSIKNDCKEILAVIDSNVTSSGTVIKTVNKNGDEVQRFDFTLDSHLEVDYADELGKYLYDPNSSIHKAQAYEHLFTHFEINKIAQNTHIGTSDELVESFPGRIFKIIGIHPFKKGQIQVPVNIVIRNFPYAESQIRKKAKLIDQGAKDYVFALRDKSDKLLLIHCEKV